jgi:hypothetical protein
MNNPLRSVKGLDNDRPAEDGDRDDISMRGRDMERNAVETMATSPSVANSSP